MTPLQALKKVKQARYFADFELDAKVGEDYKEELKIIETELKEKARQDRIVKFIQETIMFGAKLPEVKPINGTQTLTLNDITAAVSLEIQRKISNKKRELFRQWVLDTCFPKELKRLETLEEDFMSLTETNMELVQEQARNQKKLEALEIIKESVGLKMSVDEEIGCLYVPVVKRFQPLEECIVVVGFVKGKEKIDLLKEVLLGEKQ